MDHFTSTCYILYYRQRPFSPLWTQVANFSMEVGNFYLKVEVPSPEIVINLARTYRKLHCNVRKAISVQRLVRFKATIATLLLVIIMIIIILV